MKTLKKALSIVLALALMLSCVAGMQVSVSAEGEDTTTPALVLSANNPQYDLANVDPEKVGLVGVSVRVGANAGFAALGYEVTYDDALALNYVVKDGNITDYPITEENQAASSEKLTDKPYKMQWAFVENQTASEFTIAYLQFKLPEAVAADTQYNVTFTVKEAWDEAGNAVAVTESFTSTISVVDNTPAEPEEPECEYVDANQDGRCDNCGEENLDETLEFYGKAMVLGADIRGIFQVRKMKETSPYESFKVLVEKGGVEAELALVATSDKSKHTTYGYAITVAAKEMADNLNARIVGITAEGEAFISNVDTWSIKAGAVSLLDTYTAKTDADSQNRAKMLANMLNYGAEAQKHFGYNLENLATNGLKDEYTALIITEEPEMEVIAKPDETGITATLKSISLNLDAKAEILPIFKVAKSDAKESYSAEVTQTHTAPNGTVMEKSFTIAGADCLKSGTSFGVYINNLESDEMRDILTVTLYKDGVQVSATHTFSSASAIKGDLYLRNADLANALMVYGDCAYAVFGNNALTQ